MNRKKTKRKLRKLTSIMPMLEWRPDLTQTHMFRMPFKIVGGIKNLQLCDLQLYTPIKSRKKFVWANVYQKLCRLPREIYMKDVKFGFIPYHQRDKNRIVWVDQQINIPINDLKGLTFKGTAITYTEWSKTYNPYTKYSKSIINILRNNKRLQMSLPNLIQGYKNSGAWQEIKSTKGSIWDIINSYDLKEWWNILTQNDGKNIIIPNPMLSMCIKTGTFDDLTNKQPIFQPLLNKTTINLHHLEDHISNPAPKIYKDKSQSVQEFNDAYRHYVANNPF